MVTKKQNYYDILTQAINDVSRNGYDSPERIAFWMDQLKKAATASMASAAQVDQSMRDALSQIYRRMIENGQIARYHPGVERFTIDKLRHQLRTELDRRILASASLIKLNRQEMMEKTLRRFEGWATSVPPGGTKQTDKRDVKDNVKKPLAQIRFQERRVEIDQAHKLIANLNNIIATDGGAIACTWHSNWRQAGYNYRVDHKERDRKVYLLRRTWARDRGLVKPGQAGFYDDITAAGEEVFCRCHVSYIYNLRSVPKDMLTKKGEVALEEAQEKVKQMMRNKIGAY